MNGERPARVLGGGRRGLLATQTTALIVTCPVCQRTFTRKPALIQHERTHREPVPNRPYPRKDWREVYLAAIREIPVQTYGARRAGVNKSTVIGARHDDPAFAARCEEAMEEGIDAIETKAMLMARQGNVDLIKFILTRKRPTGYALEQWRLRVAGKIKDTGEIDEAEFTLLIDAPQEEA